MEARYNVYAQDFRALVQDDLGQVEDFLKSCCAATGVALIDEVWEHLQTSPGKRLRPTLLLLMAKAHGETTDLCIMGAAVVEMVHTATLIHDDVVDKAALRRGQPAVNRRWHDGIALMMGDFLYSKAFQLFSSARVQHPMALLAETTNRMSVAEMMQFQYHANLDMREDEYMLLIGEKTAALISTSCALGAVFAGASDVDAVCAYGHNVGMAFQITDDLLDYLGDEYVVGKPVGNDLREGKVTLPLITALRNAPPEERHGLLKAVRSREIFDGEWPRMLDFVSRYGGIDEAQARAQAYGQRAKQALQNVPAGAERDALADAVDFVIHRCN